MNSKSGHWETNLTAENINKTTQANKEQTKEVNSPVADKPKCRRSQNMTGRDPEPFWPNWKWWIHSIPLLPGFGQFSLLLKLLLSERWPHICVSLFKVQAMSHLLMWFMNLMMISFFLLHQICSVQSKKPFFFILISNIPDFSAVMSPNLWQWSNKKVNFPKCI